MSYTKFSKAVTKWLKDNGLPCYGTSNDSPEETKVRLDAWMRGSKEVLRQWIAEKRYRELISCAHGGWYQDDVIFGSRIQLVFAALSCAARRFSFPPGLNRLYH